MVRPKVEQAPSLLQNAEAASVQAARAASTPPPGAPPAPPLSAGGGAASRFPPASGVAGRCPPAPPPPGIPDPDAPPAPGVPPVPVAGLPPVPRLPPALDPGAAGSSLAGVQARARVRQTMRAVERRGGALVFITSLPRGSVRGR